MLEIKSMGIIPDTALEKACFVDSACFMIPLEMNNLNEDYRRAISSYVKRINKSCDITDKDDISDEIEIAVVIEFNSIEKNIQRTLFITFINAENYYIDSFDINIQFTDREWEALKNDVIFAQINSIELAKKKRAVNIKNK